MDPSLYFSSMHPKLIFTTCLYVCFVVLNTHSTSQGQCLRKWTSLCPFPEHRGLQATVNLKHSCTDMETYASAPRWGMLCGKRVTCISQKFDKIQHLFIIKGKLNTLRLEGNELNIIKAYVSNLELTLYSKMKDWRKALHLRSGIRQGFPLSACLFNIARKQESEQLDQKNKIKGTK